MAYNPYYIKRQDPYYQQGYYGGQMDSFRQALPDQGAFSARGNFFQNQGVAEQSQQGGNVGGAIMGGITSGLQGYAQGTAETNDFSIDPMAGYKGSFQGLGQGGVIGAIVGGIGAQVGTFSQVNKNLKRLNTNVEGYSIDQYGNPVFQGSAYTDAATNLQKLDEGRKAINRSWDPATRVFSGLFGTKKKIREKERKLQRSILRSQQEFNTANISSNEAFLARQAYQDQLSRNNPYGFPLNYY